MAEGGFDEFENPAFDRDIDDRLPMVPDEVYQRIISNQNDSIADLRGELRQDNSRRSETKTREDIL